jgi:hypothetical protein
VVADDSCAEDPSEELLDSAELGAWAAARSVAAEPSWETEAPDFLVAGVLEVVLTVWPGWASAATAENTPASVRLPAISQWLKRVSLRRAASRALTLGLEVIGAVWSRLIRRV